MTSVRSQTISCAAGVAIAVHDDGRFELAVKEPFWSFLGRIGSNLRNLSVTRGVDLAGRCHSIEFDFQSPQGAARRGAIRLYEDRGATIVFQTTFVEPGYASEVFPCVTNYPEGLRHLAYTGVFGGYSFNRLGPDGPWAFFDATGATFIFSPASHFMNSQLKLGPNRELTRSLVASDGKVPAGLACSTVLTVAQGVNRCFELWGNFLTDLLGKRRPANDADVGLRTLGYWTDRGATYYYHFPPKMDCEATLLAVREAFRGAQIELGYMQLDSWFYPKGSAGLWKSQDPLGGGVYLYEPLKELFPNGLAEFQRRLGLPLVTHNRWIDRKSPYRKSFKISRNMSIDSDLWADWMRRLRTSGVQIYEQDWLSGPAGAKRNLADGERFMTLMAEQAAREGLTMQYCMPLPRHFLQGAAYANLTTIRTSADRFIKARWKSFLFNGRLATALGAWPWTDVFMSSETSNLLMALLSGGMVGVGDPLGQFDWPNLARTMRRDGALIKPDTPLVPTDACYLAQSAKDRPPVVAFATTTHPGWTASYVFAFRQSKGSQEARVCAKELGQSGTSYALDYFGGSGREIAAGGDLTFNAKSNGSYWIVAPIGPSGVAFLGALDSFVPTGRSRVAFVCDAGELRARIVFAAEEDRLALHGYSARPPRAAATGGRIDNMRFDSETGRFSFDLTADSSSAVEISLRST